MMDISAFFDSVVRTMLPPKIASDDNFYHKDGYCGQGFATSPILANIAFIPATEDIFNYLNSLAEDEFAFSIYADDIQISTNFTSSEAIQKLIILPIMQIVENHGFSINDTKTRIRYAKYGYRKMLGINVGNDHIRATRKTMMKIRAAKHRDDSEQLQGLTAWSKMYKPTACR